MFQNILTTSPLIWAGLAAGLFLLPILIHLINMMRHRRVKWAAMEFLLKSHKKHRNWVWLKQLLLLLSRIAAMLLALFTLGQIGCNNDALSRFVGGSTTHHYILVDDSFSMEDRSGQISAYDRARDVIALVAARTRNQQNQRVTLLRFSQADIKIDESAGENAEFEELSVVADINGRAVDSDFDNLLEDVRSQLELSQLSVGPQAALQTVEKLIRSREKENAWVYVVSDFRTKDWNNQPEIQQQLETISGEASALELIQCAREPAPNLAITELQPEGNVRVAGIPLMMKVSVKNLGSTTASKIQVDVGTFAYDLPSGQDSPMDSEGTPEELPTVFFESIPPGETETRRFPVFFRGTGPQAVRARLAADCILSDNVAWSVVEFATSARVLIVDNETQSNSKFLGRAISPGGMTGIAPETQPKEFIRDSNLETLQQFDVIYLTDVDRLDEKAVRNLESYVEQGGGLGIFVGPYTNLAFYNSQLFKDGEGLLPMPLEKSIEIPELIEDIVPDIAPRQHLFFKPVLDMKNSPLDLVQVKQIIRPPLEWNETKDPNVEIAATIRGEANWPLIATRNFGKGKVVCVTSTVSPEWNNWARNGTYPATLLIMEDWLASGAHAVTRRQVGQPIELKYRTDRFRPSVVFVAPGVDETTRIPVEKNAESLGGDLSKVVLGGSDPQSRVEVQRPGIYEAWLTGDENRAETQRFALNIDTSESQLEVMTRQAISKQYESASPKVSRWDQFSSEIQKNSTSMLSKILLLVLIFIMIVEQILAYSCSYHPKRQVSR